MIFEDLPPTPTGDELIDKAFSRASRAGRAKSGAEAQLSMLQTAANIISDNLGNVVDGWPDFNRMDPFYYELADALVDVDELRQNLSDLSWASRKAAEIRDSYQSKVHGELEIAKKHRKQAFARLADVVESVDDALQAVQSAATTLKDLPEIDPDDPTIVVAGYPNVGKSSFVNSVTRAQNETATYPFTTTRINIGHFTQDRIRYQLVDTPGVLDRPPEDRNEIESQAMSALEHVADCVLVLIDPSEQCGYPLEKQLSLRDEIKGQFDVPVLTIGNKKDVATNDESDYEMSVTEDEGVDDVLNAAIEVINYQPTLPYES